MEAHVATVEGTIDQLDDFVAKLTEKVGTVLSKRPGFVESLALIDRDLGRGLLLTIWESRKAAEASNDQYRRDGVTLGVSAEVGLRRSVQWYDVVSVTRRSVTP